MVAPLGHLTTRRGLLSLALLCLAGCSSPPPPSTALADESNNLAKIKEAYYKATDALDRPPKNVQELKKYLTDGSPDEILRSPNDQQQYVINWGIDYRYHPRANPPAVLAYEQTGVDGQRYVLTLLGLEIMTDEQFMKADKDPKPTPPPPKDKRKKNDKPGLPKKP